jgi:hypothetical protein
MRILESRLIRSGSVQGSILHRRRLVPLTTKSTLRAATLRAHQPLVPVQPHGARPPFPVMRAAVQLPISIGHHWTSASIPGASGGARIRVSWTLSGAAGEVVNLALLVIVQPFARAVRDPRDDATRAVGGSADSLAAAKAAHREMIVTARQKASGVDGFREKSRKCALKTAISKTCSREKSAPAESIYDNAVTDATAKSGGKSGSGLSVRL